MPSLKDMWRPIPTKDGEMDSHLREGLVTNQLEEIQGNRRAKMFAGILKGWGFGGALVAGMAVLTAGVLAPYVPAAAMTMAAIEAVGNVTWPIGLAVFAVGKVKEWVNEFTRKKLLPESTSTIFRAPKKAQPATA